MESSIRVRTTPNIIGKAYKEDNEFTVKLFEAQDFNDLEPNLSDEEWLNKYGDEEHTYYVVIRHPETDNYLREDHIYSSWSTVIGTLRKMINQHDKKSKTLKG